MADFDVKTVQQKLNDMGANPPLTVDGAEGPKTDAAVKQFQQAHGLKVDGIVGPQTLGALGIQAADPALQPATDTKYDRNPNASPNIATVVAALKQAASEKGKTLQDSLAALMIGQLRGAEGAYPGVGGTLGGTDNYGAAQVPGGTVGQAFMTARKTILGWGGLAHYDSDPNKGGFLGWYWIAPSPLEGARYWLANWWGNALLNANPSTPEDYATILYKGRYFGGNHAGDDAHDPNSDAGKANIADYANNLRRGIASAAEMGAPPNMDPSTLTVNPAQFKSLSDRKITEALYNKAMSGGMGGAWKFLLPNKWDDLVATNGVVWIGPPAFLKEVSQEVGQIGQAVASTGETILSKASDVGKIVGVLLLMGGASWLIFKL